MKTAAYKEILPVQFKEHGVSLEYSILKVLAYFDVFQYPLLKSEIKQFLDQLVIEAAFDKMLLRMEQEKTIFRLDDFYSLKNDPLLAEKRQKGNLLAGTLLQKGTRIGRFLYQFPFVRAIAISGSLSKNYADEHGDIDFFIITKANRLWIARTFMHCFKKFTYLRGRQHWYCMNYYLDEQALEIKDKNIFTAIELKTLLPVSGKKAMFGLFKANPWAIQALPACGDRELAGHESSPGWLKRGLEWLLGFRMFNGLEKFLMDVTVSRWKKKEQKGKKNKKGLRMGLITGEHYVWSDPECFQDKVLSRFNEKLQELNLH